MKTCPVCALDLEDTYLFCPDDGSTLASLPGHFHESEPVSADGPDDETASAVVLYCPMCAAEYPLTFSSCPVHGVQLTKHRIPRSSKSQSIVREPDAGAQATMTGLPVQEAQPTLTKPLTTLDLKRPQIEPPTHATAYKSDDLDNNYVIETEIIEDEPVEPDVFGGGTTTFEDQESVGESRDRRLESPGFRVAAIATGAGGVSHGLAEEVRNDHLSR